MTSRPPSSPLGKRFTKQMQRTNSELLSAKYLGAARTILKSKIERRISVVKEDITARKIELCKLTKELDAMEGSMVCAIM